MASSERRKDELKEKLLKLGYFKTPDDRQLYEMGLEELKKIYENLKNGGADGK
ncbi:Fur-regulated basic protein FbpA [Heyndrickxia coagulans]|uniref:Fur-regulated basic protein FbpA n=1 Tax=Heyndrickxia coagulans TaxID=1398 RepID=UPI002E03D216|nr:Fur-regulated basic protein FbpA [Heyndrickxia coagulans]